MKALNDKERNEMFLKFVVLYFLSVLIIVLTVLFNVESNKEELATLKKLELSSGGITQILSKSDSISSLLNFCAQNPESTNGVFQMEIALRLIVDLKENVVDSSLQNKFVLRLANSYSDLYNLTRDLSRLRNDSSSMRSNLNNSNRRAE